MTRALFGEAGPIIMELSFSPEDRQLIARLRERYPQPDACIMPVLDLAQREFGHLSPEILALVAATLGVLPQRVHSTASFYSMYRFAAVGTYHFQVCSNLCCYLRGGEELLATLESELGIKVGESSADGRFTLSTVECLAACGTAPVLQLNGAYHEGMTPAKAAALVSTLARGGGA